MKTLSSSTLAANMAAVLGDLPQHPDGIVITWHGRRIARLIPEHPSVGPASTDPVQRAAYAVLGNLQASPWTWLPWKDVRPSHRLRRGVTTEEVLDALRGMPGVRIRPSASRNGQGHQLQYVDDDLL